MTESVKCNISWCESDPAEALLRASLDWSTWFGEADRLGDLCVDDWNVGKDSPPSLGVYGCWAFWRKDEGVDGWDVSMTFSLSSDAGWLLLPMGGLARSRPASECGVTLVALGRAGDIGTDWDPMAWLSLTSGDLLYPVMGEFGRFCNASASIRHAVLTLWCGVIFVGILAFESLSEVKVQGSICDWV